MSTTFAHFGNKAAATTGLTAAIGGTASAGDILVVVAAEVDGTSGPDPSLVDNLGSTGWVKIADVLADSGDAVNDYHGTWWTKICVGGETTVGVVPGGGGPSNVAFVGFWAATPTHSAPYVIDEGFATFTGGTPVGQIFTDANAPSTNGQSYIYLTASGRVAATLANMVAPSATAGEAQLLSGCVQAIALANDQEGSNTTIDRPEYTEGTNSADMHIYAVLIGFQDGPPPADLNGVGDLLLGGGGELTTSGGVALLQGVGDLLLGGEGLLDQEGGEGFLAGIGTLIVGGAGRLTAPDPFPPIPPTPGMRGVLGCGIYDVFIFTRGLGEIVGRIPFNALQWGRVLDDTSAAQVTVDGVSNTGPMASCCQLLGSIEPYEHELGIYRNGFRCWSGPVLDVTFPSEQVVIDAEDLSSWLKIRQLHDGHNWVGADLALMWVDMVLDAMSVDNTAGLYAIVQALTGVTGARLYTPDMGTFAADAISELARTGLDWYTVDRRMVGGPVAEQPASFAGATPIPTLTDESFRAAPTVTRSGSLMGNAWFSGASGQGPGGNAIFGQYGPAFPATPDHLASPAAPDYAAIKAKYGRIERRVNETKILDQASADQNAATRYDLCKIAVDVISSGTLLPTAGIDIRQLIPGSIQNIHLTRACVQIGEPYRLKSLAVTAQSDGSEDVVGAWEPVGSLTAHEDLGGS